MKSINFSVLFLISFSFTSFSQSLDTTQSDVSMKRNTIYLEILGQGLYNSLNFDRILHPENRIKHSITGGLSYFRLSYLEEVAALGSYNFLFGKKNHHLELGIGLSVMSLISFDIQSNQSYPNPNGGTYTVAYTGSQHSIYSYFTPKIGYRFQKPTGGFFYRLSFTPALAGVNYIGPIEGGGNTTFGGYYEIFNSAAFFGSRIFPWVGMSFGYTLKYDKL